MRAGLQKRHSILPPRLRDWAIVSIGTNSTRYLTTDFSRVTLKGSVGTRIGEGLRESGRLGELPMQRTLDAIAEHLKAIRGRYEHLYVIATSALRRADNAAEFAARVTEMTGASLQILSGEEEARGAFRGAAADISPGDDRNIGVLDAGGGSSEYAIGANGCAARTVSCEIGAVRLTERCPELAGADGPIEGATVLRARKLARECLSPIAEFDRVHRLIFVGGSASTTAAVIRCGTSLVDPLEFSRENLGRTLGSLIELPLPKRRLLAGMNPQRADILAAGMLILDTVFELTGHSHATVSLKDLLYGFLLLEREKLASSS